MNASYDSAMSENDKLINFIASTVEGLRQRIDTISEQMATKVRSLILEMRWQPSSR